jgi:hypothetical protein
MPWRSSVLPGLEWGVASAVHRAERESGDSCVVRTLADGILIAVIDGLGHGSEAARAAHRAREVIERAQDRDLRTIVRACHDHLRDTRGVVIGLAALDPTADSLTWLGVGNVAGHVLRAERAEQAERSWLRREELLVRGGTVGGRLPALAPIVRAVHPGDLIVLATDGLRAGFTHRIWIGDALQGIADEILASHHRADDDALVFVGRYVGRQRLAA